ncbi:MAG: hypothetical protein ACI93N_002093 [Flavobacteriaceae bacterium]|jgi:hypothetical protein
MKGNDNNQFYYYKKKNNITITNMYLFKFILEQIMCQ